MAAVKFTDYFALLEVTPATSKEGIKKAFMAKALIFHPDKAKTPGERKSFGKVYEDLQNAYRILSSDVSRKQYLDANQKTNLDLAREVRDVTYKYTPVKPINSNFHDAFNATRDQKEQEKMAKIHARLAKGGTVSQREVLSYIEQRNKDTFEIQTLGTLGALGENPGQTGVQIYTEPLGYSTGLDERANISLLNVSFDGVAMDKLIGNNDISGTGLFNTEEYCPVPLGTLENKIKLIQQERENYRKLAQTDFKTAPSEIEVTYAELFKPAIGEGLGRT